jgi:hypothetical protein
MNHVPIGGDPIGLARVLAHRRNEYAIGERLTSDHEGTE